MRCILKKHFKKTNNWERKNIVGICSKMDTFRKSRFQKRQKRMAKRKNKNTHR